jgi:DNA-binding transcriptional regulator LsrR (DeoR family)
VDWKRGQIISRKKEKTQMSLVVHNPTSGPVAKKETLAERLDTLENGVLGVINNGKYHSDTVLNKIAERLKSLYTLKNVIVVQKDSASRAVKEDIAKRLAGECDFVIAGIGD